jgi:STE24 endopeptidase
VQGLGPTVRISLNDNLLRQGSPEEVKAVMGHELGHYVFNHIPKMIPVLALIILVLFGILAWAGAVAVRRRGAAWGISSLGDRTIIPVAAIVLSLFFLALTPVTNTMVRTSEQEADVFGLNAAREPDGFAAIAMKLSTYRKLEPGPWEERIFFDHPSGRTRATTAMQWKAENLEAAE